MQSKKYHELLIRLLEKSNSVILTRQELIEIIVSEKNIEELSNENFLFQERNTPTHCLVHGCDSRDIEYEFKDNKVIVTDLQNPDHKIEDNINKWITCELNIQKIVQYLLESIFGSIKCSNTTQIENMYAIQTTFNNSNVDIIFSLSNHIYEDELFKALGPSLIFKRPVIIISKDTEENFDEINSICLKLPLGNFVYPFYVKDFNNKETGEDLNDWINRILEIKKMEENIIKDLPKNALS